MATLSGYEIHHIGTAAKVAYVADVHIGNHQQFGGPMSAGLNVRCQTALDAFSRALAKAVELKCTTFVVLGDLFDSHRPSPQVIAAVQRVIEHFKGQLTVILVAGNHDKASDASGDHALAALQHHAKIVDTTPLWLSESIDVKTLLVPYQSGAAPEWMQEHIDLCQKHSKTRGIFGIATHVGLITAKTPPWLRAAHDAVPIEQFNGVPVIAGNWHKTLSSLDDYWVQCGALVPTGFDNLSEFGVEHYGSLWVWNPTGDKRLKRQVIIGPRFWTTHYETLENWKTQRGRLANTQHYVKIKASLADIAAAQAELAQMVKMEIVRGGIVEPDANEKDLTHKNIVRAVHNAASIDEALLAFLKKQQMPEGVKAAKVGELTREYIKQAQKHQT